MPTTDDPNDPRLSRGVDEGRVPQADAYLVLSEEERAKGFTRPLRTAYRHVGIAGPRYELRPFTPDEIRAHSEHGDNYVAYEPYPMDEKARGRFWTQRDLDRIHGGCQSVTTMGLDLSETYARQPSFYGATFCVTCSKHLPVAEFVWTADGERVGT